MYSQIGLIHLFYCPYITTRQLKDFHFCLPFFTNAIQTSSYIVCTPPPFLLGGAHYQIFKKRGLDDRISIFRGGYWERGDLFQGWGGRGGGLQFLHSFPYTSLDTQIVKSNSSLTIFININNTGKNTE